jgi:1-acyl-sn-glycerol-3-phosphate acyltransferase
VSSTLVTETKKSILREAAKHDGQYLITRANYRDKTDVIYLACDELVQGGQARWIDAASNYYPGILLTGKPLEAA